MKTVAVLCLLIAVAHGAPTAVDAARRALPAIHHEEIHDDFGQYALRYVTAEGITYEERGRLVPDPDGKEYVLIYEGEYSFIGDDGKTYKTKYTTDIANGHKVQANHVPTAPEFQEESKIPEVASTTEEAKSI
ncbi:larval cuticle protein 65Ag1-like [Plodia interpunctella]|uniref:larval cuticle protein 65Ag1-like n=1 Tax=Plodia interpunctella TaxID=58824 RepID=UPI002367ACB4|nr:larval cuticle protein 65Ag1-like [Plodia interpunctella]